MLELAQFVLIGLGIGTFGSLVGLGGGLIMVPLFMLTMMPPNGGTFTTVQQVVGTSLFGVLLNAISGSWAYVRQRRLVLRAAVPFALATIPGAFMGSFVSKWFTGPVFSIAFGTVLGLLGLFMYARSRRAKPSQTCEDFDPETFYFPMGRGVGWSFVIGFLSSIFGIGGGVIHVPMMIIALGFPAHVAVATSTFVLMISSVVGVIGHAWLDHIVWVPAVAVGGGAIVGAQIGAHLSKKSKPKVLMLILSLVMLCVGALLIWRGVA